MIDEKVKKYSQELKKLGIDDGDVDINDFDEEEDEDFEEDIEEDDEKNFTESKWVKKTN